MSEIPVFISLSILINYFFTAFILSYIAPKVRIGKMFWYGLEVTRTLLTPAEIRMMENEEKMRKRFR